MAHFIEHIIFKGTKKRNTYQVLSYLENVGGDLNAYTTKEETFFYASVLNTYLGRALELLCDIVFNSSFNTKDIETEKDVVIEEIKSYQDNPSEAIFDEFENLIFDGHPLGTNILGTKKSVKSFTQKKINEFIKQNYHTDQMVIAIVGNVSFNKCIALTEKHAGVISENMRNIQRQAFTQYSLYQKQKETTAFKPMHDRSGIPHTMKRKIKRPFC